MNTLPASTLNVRKLLYLAPLAGLLAAAVNVVLFLISRAAGAFPVDLVIPNLGRPLGVMQVVISSFVPALAAGVLLALLMRFTRKPLKIFNFLSLAFLVFSFYSPFTIPDVPLSMALTLELMHFVAAAAVLWVFNRRAGERTSARH